MESPSKIPKQITSRRRRPRQAEAWPRPRPFPCGTARGEPHRPGQWVEQGQARQRTPANVWLENTALQLTGNVGGCGVKTYQGWVADKLAGQPKEGLLEVIIGLGRDVVILEIFLPVEGDGLGLHLPLLDIDLVAAENDRDILTDADEITCIVVSI